MKRTIITVILALAVIFSLTQCKKRIETVTQSSQGGTFITLNVSNNAKYHVGTTSGDMGQVGFTSGDYVFVASDGNPVGMLIYDGEKFEGPIGEGNYLSLPYSPKEGEPLYFCFTSNRLPDDGERWAFDISDQRDALPVFSCGVSEENYSSEQTVYNSFLENQCALVKFTLGTAINDDVRVANMLSEVQMSITASGVEINATGKRCPIILNKPAENSNTERWAILLPQDQITVGAVVGNTAYANAVTVPKIEYNGLHTASINLNSSSTQLTPYFGIGNGRLVYFSTGNLQYNIASENYNFATNQYDYIGGTDEDDATIKWGNVSGYTNDGIADATYTGSIDLFGWGTGDNPTENTVNRDNPYASFVDWGSYVDDGKWFTLNRDEWDYLIDVQATSHTERADKTAPATINTDTNPVKGVVILPDVWSLPSDCSFTAPSGVVHSSSGYIPNMNDFTMNEYTSAEWTAMATAGAVFLPCNGHWGEIVDENNVSVYKEKYFMDSPNMFRGYWSSDEKGDYTCWALEGKTQLKGNDFFKYQKMSVRLVRDVIY